MIEILHNGNAVSLVGVSHVSNQELYDKVLGACKDLHFVDLVEMSVFLGWIPFIWKIEIRYHSIDNSYLEIIFANDRKSIVLSNKKLCQVIQDLHQEKMKGN